MIATDTQVRLVVPDNPALHRQLATVVEPTAWGAHVATPVGSGRFRALHAEMEPVAVAQPTSPAFTGDVCPTCGGSKMIRAGACATCLDCGSSSGCG